MLLSVLIAAVIIATALFVIWHGRQATRLERLRGMNSMGVVLAEQTSRYTQVIDLILLEVQSKIGNLHIETPAEFQQKLGTQEVHDYLAGRLKNVPQADAIVLIDANGRILNWTRSWPLAYIDISHRDYYKYFKEHNDPGLFGSLSRNSSKGTLSLFFTRRINAADGRFLGLVLGVVDTKYLSDFYRAAGEHIRQQVTLLRRDGTMLMRYPDPSEAIDVKLPVGSSWYAAVSQGGGNYVTSGVLDGIPALVAVHPLKDYPLVVDVVTRESDVFSQWRREAVFTTVFALTAALALAGLFWMLARQFRRQAEQNAKLEHGRQQFDAVLSNITQGICFFDADKRLLLSNRQYAEIYNLPLEATRVGTSLKEIVYYRHAAGTIPEMEPIDYLAWRDKIDAARQHSNTTVKLRNGRTIGIYRQPMPGGGWVATHEDITERQQAEANVLFMAHHDALTQLPNRVLFKDRMERAIATVGRGSMFALLCLDLDKFKEVNDTLGHPAGDGLLVEVAKRLQACIREGDTVARLGGDEFAIIQLGIKSIDDTEILVSRIIAAFAHPFNVIGHQITAGTSIGVSVAASHDASYESLMRDADIALYLAKTEGYSSARFFEPEMDARIHLRRELERDLRGAIARNEFELYYQPQVSLVSNKICGFEALLRWNHPDRGLVSPLEFIPVAEETGMIVQIGGWALQQACLEAQNWPGGISVAVNLSAVQFKKIDLVDMVHTALTASGLQPERLELEITESVLLHDTPGVLTALHQLRAMGICVALDDFGTGYSSLSYLRSFPFNKIKIDKSFVQDLLINKESMSIVRAVMGLGRSLDIRITAEGVETVEQLNWLRREACTEVQGYLFSKPSPANEVPRLINMLQRGEAAVQGYYCCSATD